VGGRPAITLTSTTTSVTFQVPSALVPAWIEPSAKLLKVTVRTHGRVSGPVPAAFAIEPVQPSYLLTHASEGASQACVAGACIRPAMVDTADGVYGGRYASPGTGADTLTAYDTTGARTWEVSNAGGNIAVALAGGRQMVSHHASRLTGDPQAFTLCRTLAGLRPLEGLAWPSNRSSSRIRCAPSGVGHGG